MSLPFFELKKGWQTRMFLKCNVFRKLVIYIMCLTFSLCHHRSLTKYNVIDNRRSVIDFWLWTDKKNKKNSEDSWGCPSVCIRHSILVMTWVAWDRTQKVCWGVIGSQAATTGTAIPPTNCTWHIDLECCCLDFHAARLYETNCNW